MTRSRTQLRLMDSPKSAHAPRRGGARAASNEAATPFSCAAGTTAGGVGSGVGADESAALAARARRLGLASEGTGKAGFSPGAARSGRINLSVGVSRSSGTSLRKRGRAASGEAAFAALCGDESPAGVAGCGDGSRAACFALVLPHREMCSSSASVLSKCSPHLGQAGFGFLGHARTCLQYPCRTCGVSTPQCGHNVPGMGLRCALTLT